MAETTVVPNGTFSNGSTDAIGAATHHECVDEGTGSSDGDTTYIQGGSGETVQLNLGDMPVDFGTATAVTIRIRSRRTSDKGDVGIVTAARLYQSDGSTAITDASGNIAQTTSYVTNDSVRTITGATTKTVWDGAIVSITCSGGANTVRITAVDVIVTYTASGGGGGGSSTRKLHKLLLGSK